MSPNRTAPIAAPMAVALFLTLVVACGDDGTTTPPPPGPIPDLHAIGSSTNQEFDQFAVGDDGTILHYQGLEWEKVASHTTVSLRGVTGINLNTAFAVGDKGTILRWDGAIWTAENSNTTQNLRAVWGTTVDNLIAVGDHGIILQRSGGVWNTVASGSTSANWYGVYALADGEAYAVGDAGTVAHRTGATWSAVTAFTTSRLRAVWAAPRESPSPPHPRDWFAVGDNGEIWQERGSGWTPMVSPRTDDFYCIAGSDSAFVWAAGDADSILFYDGFDWRPKAPRYAGRLEGIWAFVCPLARALPAAAAGLHCSNTYFAGTTSVVTRFTLLGSYEVMNDPR
ncbi:MAG TPA: hypothetical protein VFH33_01355 [Candidatus Krumholzibacteria bacterium]|nr:hypothetical protein [Candidatus Krumholzibacteria bacterium]